MVLFYGMLGTISLLSFLETVLNKKRDATTWLIMLGTNAILVLLFILHYKLQGELRWFLFFLGLAASSCGWFLGKVFVLIRAMF